MQEDKMTPPMALDRLKPFFTTLRVLVVMGLLPKFRIRNLSQACISQLHCSASGSGQQALLERFGVMVMAYLKSSLPLMQATDNTKAGPVQS